MATLGSWTDLWNEYPDYISFPDSSEVKKGIGGAVNARWITNTCAIRLSRALNYTGILVPMSPKGGTGRKEGHSHEYKPLPLDLCVPPRPQRDERAKGVPGANRTIFRAVSSGSQGTGQIIGRRANREGNGKESKLETSVKLETGQRFP
jgi:hypothetical protein